MWTSLRTVRFVFVPIIFSHLSHFYIPFYPYTCLIGFLRFFLPVVESLGLFRFLRYFYYLLGFSFGNF